MQEKFQTIVLDTADIMYSYCEKFICNREGVDNISEIAYGKGFGMVSSEFDEAIRKILQLNYGVVLISHATDKTFKDENGNEYNQIVPTLNTRGRLICDRTCDIIGYARMVESENGKETRLFLRGTPRYVAGSRFKYLPDSIPFDYKQLADAIADAIDKEAQENDGQFVTNQATQVKSQDVEYDFDGLMDKFQELVDKLMESSDSTIPMKITQVVEKYLGRGKKVVNCTPSQSEQLDLIVHDLEFMANS